MPEKYRAPIVLCDLQGRTHQEAARCLGWPIGTVKSRQLRGRGLLRDRMARRGLAPAVTGIVVESLRQTATAAIPGELARITVNASMRQAGRLLSEYVISRQVLTLSRGVLRAMLLIRMRFVAVAVLAIGLASTGAIFRVVGSREGAPKADRAASPGPAKSDGPPSKISKETAVEDESIRLTLEEAVKAAMSITDPSARRSVLVRIANAQSSMNDNPSARITLRLAQQSAETIKTEMDRHFGLWRVAKLQAKTGDVEAARQTFSRIIRDADAKAPWDRMSLLGQIAVAQDQGGLHADALETLNKAIADADAIEARTPNGDIYYNIVWAQCQIGDFDGTLRIAEGLKGDQVRYRQTYLEYLARDCDKAGPAEARRILTKARELSKGIKNVYPRALAQKAIAQAMARNGDISGALATSKLIGQVDEAPASRGIFSFFNSRQAEVNRQAEKSNAEMARHDIADVLIVVAAEQARTGDRSAAKKTFGESMEMILGEPPGLGVLKTQRLRGLVEALAGAGELEAARTAIEAIQGDEANKAKALVALAKAQARAGDRTSARASLSAAFDPAREIKADPNTINDNVADRKDETFRAVAMAQVELGEGTDALTTVSAHSNEQLKAEVQAEVAGLQARRGDLAAASKTAEAIKDVGFKAEALSRIAHARSRTGRRDVAHDWAARLDSPQERALALVGVAEGVIARRRGE